MKKKNNNNNKAFRDITNTFPPTIRKGIESKRKNRSNSTNSNHYDDNNNYREGVQCGGVIDTKEEEESHAPATITKKTKIKPRTKVSFALHIIATMKECILRY